SLAYQLKKEGTGPSGKGATPLTATEHKTLIRPSASSSAKELRSKPKNAMSCLKAISICFSTSSPETFANLEERSASKTSNARCRWGKVVANGKAPSGIQA